MFKLDIIDDASESTARINAMIDDVRIRMASITDDIQATAVNIVLHAVKHGDGTAAERLFDAVSRSANRKSLIEFFNRYTCIKLETAGTSKNPTVKSSIDKAKRKKMLKRDSNELAEELMAKPWNQAKAVEPGFGGFILKQEIAKLLGLAEKIADDPVKSAHPKTDLAGLVQLRQIKV